MKIALITIHCTTNYGAALQAYATKKILSQFGEVNIIDYQNRFLAHQVDLIRFDATRHGILKFMHDLLRLPYRIITLKKFRRFVQSNFDLTPKLTAGELTIGKANKYDVYVCGSDQIWNPEIVSVNKVVDPIFFLSFAPKGVKKISYGSSIGHYHYSLEERRQVADYLKEFSLITTREDDGVEKLSKILPDKDIHHVLDPTLLFSKKEWLEAFQISAGKSEKKYLLVYSVPRTELLKKAVKYYANKTGLEVVVIDQALFPLVKANRYIRSGGLVEFVELFANADFVVTDSFHGVCFSVNFGKPFIAISPGKRANRITSLLTLLGIKGRLVINEDGFKAISMIGENKSVMHKLERERNNCLSLLSSCLNGSHEL
jgi:hypothetical protein